MRDSASDSRPVLQTRYARALSFGAILDETFQLYRRAWRTMIGISAVWALPFVLALFGYSRALNASLATAPGAGSPTFASQDEVLGIVVRLVVGGMLFALASSIFAIVGTAAVTAATDAVMRGQRPSVLGAYRAALRRLPVLLGGTLAYLLGILLLTAVSVGLIGLTLVVVGLLVSSIALVVWLASPGARRPWLKWAIILTSPLGLVTYYGIRWSLYVQVGMLERAGALRTLGRSSQLVQGHWFRALGVLTVVGLIATILQGLPSAVVGLVVGLVSARATPNQPSLVTDLATNAASFVATSLFSAIPLISAVVLLVDLRNRHEGADLAERTHRLEQALETTG